MSQRRAQRLAMHAVPIEMLRLLYHIIVLGITNRLQRTHLFVNLSNLISQVPVSLPQGYDWVKQ